MWYSCTIHICILGTMALNEEYTPFHTIVINDTEQKRPNTQNRLIFAMGSATLAAMLVYVSMPLQPTPSALWNAPAHVMRANPTTHVVTQQRVNAASLPSTRPSALGPLSPVSVPDMHTMHDVERSIVHPQPPSSFGSWPMWAMLFPAIASVAFVLGRWGAGQKYQWAMAAMDGESPRNRVFVQGLPPSVTWRELKDHFRIAGNVVYGNVTTDRDTGISKGFGVVEYETHEEAQYAIEIMQDHPLEGSVLNVREDRDRGSNRGWNNRPWTPQRNVEWARARDDPTADGSEEDAARAEAVYEALVERDGHRSSRWFDEADRIRDELWEQGIGVDDQRKVWARFASGCARCTDACIPCSVSALSLGPETFASFKVVSWSLTSGHPYQLGALHPVHTAQTCVALSPQRQDPPARHFSVRALERAEV